MDSFPLIVCVWLLMAGMGGPPSWEVLLGDLEDAVQAEGGRILVSALFTDDCEGNEALADTSLPPQLSRIPTFVNPRTYGYQFTWPADFTPGRKGGVQEYIVRTFPYRFKSAGKYLYTAKDYDRLVAKGDDDEEEGAGHSNNHTHAAGEGGYDNADSSWVAETAEWGSTPADNGPAAAPSGSRMGDRPGPRPPQRESFVGGT
jgi:hypothetical protein